jgi:di/tricarboxylate transporter
MSFASLLGGLMTLVGTSPNIIVSRVREDMTGTPFRMFDYLPVGLGLTVMGLLFLRFGYRLLPGDRRAAPTMGEALDIQDYVTEARVAERSEPVGETIAAFVARHGHDVTVTQVLRAGIRTTPWPELQLRSGDVLILGGAPDTLEQVIAGDGLELEGHDRATPEGSEDDEVGVIEAVLGADSVLVGQTAGRMLLQARYGVNLIAISRRGERLTRRLANTVLCPGDVIVLQGPLGLLPERLRMLGCLPLAERSLRLGNARKGLLPLGVLGGLLCGRRGGDPDRRPAGAGSLYPYRVADPGDAGRADPGQRYASHHRHERHHRHVAVAYRGVAAGVGRHRADLGCGDGGDAVPQQCGDGAGDGADRRHLCGRPRLSA